MTATTLPDASCSTWSAMLLGRTSRFPVASPVGISEYSVDHFAPDLQPWKQNPICWHDPRPSRGSLLIAIRPVWTSLYPSFLAPASITLKLLLPGNPGMLLVRVTPILFSALPYHGSISASVIGQSSRFVAGRLAKSLPTRQLPDVVRISVQASCVKLSHSLLMKSCSSVRGPASRITTLTPFWASSLPKVPPPAPEPTTTTTPSSFRSNFAMMSSQPDFVRSLQTFGSQSMSLKPRLM